MATVIRAAGGDTDDSDEKDGSTAQKSAFGRGIGAAARVLDALAAKTGHSARNGRRSRGF